MAEARGEKRDARSAMGVLDAVAVAAAMLGLAALWLVQLLVVPRFVTMYADFGSDVALPALTQLVARPIALGVLSLVVLVATGGGLGLRHTGVRAGGGVALGLAAVLPWVAVPAMLVALYLPILTVSGAIAP